MYSRIDWASVLTFSFRLAVRCVVVLFLATALVACAQQQRRAKRPLPPERPAASETAGPPPNVSECREYADTMAGRQMERDFDSISGNFEGGSSQVFQDFARLDAQRYYRQLYESCLSQHRASKPEAADR